MNYGTSYNLYGVNYTLYDANYYKYRINYFIYNNTALHVLRILISIWAFDKSSAAIYQLLFGFALNYTCNALLVAVCRRPNFRIGENLFSSIRF
jgi:hypothetical protein